MKDLIKQIAHWERISEVLEPDELERRRSVELVSEYGNAFINKLDSSKTFQFSDKLSSAFDIDQNRKSLDQVIELYDEEVANKGIKASSGGHMGYIPGGGLFASSLGDFLADVTNEYAGIFYGSPGAVSMETALIEWMKTIFSYPKNAVGNLASGGSIANMIALTSARDAHKIKGNLIEKSVIYLSSQTHHCVTKALRIIGLEDVILRTVNLDERSRMNINDLKRLLKKDKESGLNPFLIVGSAGTTDTGAIDPLEEIGEICQNENLWYHIDAAYGGFFILTESRKRLFKGIELSDSLVVDPHKGLFIPYGIGAVLIKNKETVFHSHSSQADYMQDAYRDDLPINPADLSPELTKHFRGMRMWLPLQLYGIEPFAACLEEKLLLTEYLRERLAEMGFSLGPKPDLSVTYFWYENEKTSAFADAIEEQKNTIDSSEYLGTNRFNQHLLDEIHKDGSYYFSSTRINGKFVIRAAILSFRTKLKQVDKSLEMIQTCLEKTKNHFEAPH